MQEFKVVQEKLDLTLKSTQIVTLKQWFVEYHRIILSDMTQPTIMTEIISNYSLKLQLNEH